MQRGVARASSPDLVVWYLSLMNLVHDGDEEHTFCRTSPRGLRPAAPHHPTLKKGVVVRQRFFALLPHLAAPPISGAASFRQVVDILPDLNVPFLHSFLVQAGYNFEQPVGDP